MRKNRSKVGRESAKGEDYRRMAVEEDESGKVGAGSRDVHYQNKSVRQLLDDIRMKNYKTQQQTRNIGTGITDYSTGKYDDQMLSSKSISKSQKQRHTSKSKTTRTSPRLTASETDQQFDNKYYDHANSITSRDIAGPPLMSPPNSKSQKNLGFNFKEPDSNSQQDGITPRYLRDTRHLVDSESQIINILHQPSSGRIKTTNYKTQRAGEASLNWTDRLQQTGAKMRFIEDSEGDRLVLKNTEGYQEQTRPKKIVANKSQKSIDTTLDLQGVSEQDAKGILSTPLQGVEEVRASQLKETSISHISNRSNNTQTNQYSAMGAGVTSCFNNDASSNSTSLRKARAHYDSQTLNQLKLKAKTQTALLCLNKEADSQHGGDGAEVDGPDQSFREAIKLTQTRINMFKEGLNELSLMMENMEAQSEHSQSQIKLQKVLFEKEDKQTHVKESKTQQKPKNRKKRDARGDQTKNRASVKKDQKTPSTVKSKTDRKTVTGAQTSQQVKPFQLTANEKLPATTSQKKLQNVAPQNQPTGSKAQMFDRLCKEKLGKIKGTQRQNPEVAAEKKVQILSQEIKEPLSPEKINKQSLIVKSSGKQMIAQAPTPERKSKSFVSITEKNKQKQVMEQGKNGLSSNKIIKEIQDIRHNRERTELILKNLQKKYGVTLDDELGEDYVQKNRSNSALKVYDEKLLQLNQQQKQRSKTTLKFLRPEEKEAKLAAQQPVEITKKETEITDIKPVSRLSNVAPPEIKINSRINPFKSKRRSKSIEKIKLKSYYQRQNNDFGVDQPEPSTAQPRDTFRRSTAQGARLPDTGTPTIPDDSLISSIRGNTVQVMETVPSNNVALGMNHESRNNNQNGPNAPADALQLSSDMSEIDLDRGSKDRVKVVMTNIKNLQLRKAQYLGEQGLPNTVKALERDDSAINTSRSQQKCLVIVEPDTKLKVMHSKITTKSYREKFVELLLYSNQKLLNQSAENGKVKQNMNRDDAFIYNSSIRILKILLEFLKSEHGPAQDEFRLFMASKAFQTTLLDFSEKNRKEYLSSLNDAITAYQVSQPQKVIIKKEEQKIFKRTVYAAWLKQSYFKSRIISVLHNQPNLSKYRGNLQNRLKIQKSFNDELFGGNITIGLNNHQIFQSEPHSIKKLTNIRKQIHTATICDFSKTLAKGEKDQWQGRGYYYLQNVRISPVVFWDIHILVDKASDDKNTLEKLYMWHLRSLQMYSNEKNDQKVSILKPYINKYKIDKNLHTNQKSDPLQNGNLQDNLKNTQSTSRKAKKTKEDTEKQGRTSSVGLNRRQNVEEPPILIGETYSQWQETLRTQQNGSQGTLAIGSRPHSRAGQSKSMKRQSSSSTKQEGDNLITAAASLKSQSAVTIVGGSQDKKIEWNSSSNLNSKRHTSPQAVILEQNEKNDNVDKTPPVQDKNIPGSSKNDILTSDQKKDQTGQLLQIRIDQDIPVDLVDLQLKKQKSSARQLTNLDVERMEQMYKNQNFIDFKEIKDCLSGFARIYEFNNFAHEQIPRRVGPISPSNGKDITRNLKMGFEELSKLDSPSLHLQFHQKQNKLQYLNEGQIWKGHFEGFVRSLDFKGNCQVGFWSVRTCLGNKSPFDIKSQTQIPRTLISRPYGKWAQYNSEGETVFVEGIYRGDHLQWNRLITPTKLDNFQTNIQPQLSLGQRFSDMFQNCCSCQSQQQVENRIFDQAKQCQSASASLGLQAATPGPQPQRAPTSHNINRPSQSHRTPKNK